MNTGLSAELDKDSWLEARYNSVTCTDLGKILGADDSTSRKKLLWSKINRTDLLQNASPITKRLVQLGHLFEPQARETFVKLWEESGINTKGFVPTMQLHTKHNWFTGSPDYLIPESKVVAEFKTHFFPDMETVRPIASIEKIPLKYYLQVQGYLEIMDYSVGYLLSWTLKNGHSMYAIHRDKTLFDELILPSIEEFYGWMKAGSDPEELYKLATFRPGQKSKNVGRIFESLKKNGENEILPYN
jgi:predicted phage-related endonuclease